MQMDNSTKEIVLIGKIDSEEEINALTFAKTNILKPITLYLYGQSLANNPNLDPALEEFPIARTIEQLADILRHRREYDSSMIL